MLKLYSWNVNGIRAAQKKGFLQWLTETQPDLLGIQETKAHLEQLNQELISPPNYETYWHSGQKKGYSGVALYSKITPQKILTTFPHQILNAEGRIIQAEFENFTLFNIYFPNGKRDQERLNYKLNFYDTFLEHLKTIEKPIIICGDINTAHQEIDLSNPIANKNTSGFLRIERDWLDKLQSKGFIDTFRHFNKHPNQYTWWDQKTRARDRNIGWRIDYFFCSSELSKNLINAEIHPQILGSDHCPISLTLKF